MPCKRKAAPAQGPRSPLSVPGEASGLPAPRARGLCPRPPQPCALAPADVAGTIPGAQLQGPRLPLLGPRLPPPLWPARRHLQQAPQRSPSPASEVPGGRRALSEAELAKVRSEQGWRLPCAGDPEGAQRGGSAQGREPGNPLLRAGPCGWSLPQRADSRRPGEFCFSQGLSGLSPARSQSSPAAGLPLPREHAVPQNTSVSPAAGQLPGRRSSACLRTPASEVAILFWGHSVVTESFLRKNASVFAHVAPKRVSAPRRPGVCPRRGSVSMRTGRGSGRGGSSTAPMSSPRSVRCARKRGEAPARTGPRGGRPPPGEAVPLQSH